MSTTDVPLCLKRARDEVLMALSAESAEDEGAHRRLADRYVSKAVHIIEHEPEREYDWSGLAADG
jgi:hypothetical protein